jgi:hypothetical protein
MPHPSRTRCRFDQRFGARGLLVAAVLLAPVALVLAQDENVAFIIAVADQNGRPVADLTRDEIVLTENGVAVEIVKVQPFQLPVALTVAVDNGPLSGDALGHYRSGLTALVRALPMEMEVTLITMSPQPMMVVQPTMDRLRLLRGVNAFAPQEDSPRFTDTLVEFSRRYETALKETNRIASVPVLLMISTSVPEAVSYSSEEITRAIAFLERRKAMVHVVMLNIRRGASAAATINDARQTMIAIPATKVTKGRYEALANSSRLVTLLPEMGAQIGTLHRRQVNQLLVTARRQPGRRGPLQNPQIGLTRNGMTGSVSLDGLP